MPPFAAGRVTPRERVLEPMPHALLHALHAFQLDTVQSTGQPMSVQERVASGWQCPPCRAGLVIGRVRFCVPAPHDFEHELHPPQLPTSHGTPHGCSLQPRDSVSSGHTYPPKRSCISTLRVRPDCPLPQLFVHVVQAPHCDTRQCTGQAPGLQWRCSVLGAQAKPPCAAATTTLRVRFCAPDSAGPHVLSHSLQSDQYDIAQFTGQLCELHTLVEVSDGHALPPWSAERSTVRWRIFVPAPHEWEQAPHWPKPLTTQSTGQGVALQPPV